MVATTANEAATSPEIPVSGYKETGATAAPTVPLTAAIILPAFNEALALPSVLTSLVAVLGANCEVIVVDDGSTDETAFVASRYPCRLVRHEHNRGKGAASHFCNNLRVVQARSSDSTFAECNLSYIIPGQWAA